MIEPSRFGDGFSSAAALSCLRHGADQAAVMLGESLARRGPERFDELQIVVCRDRSPMPHIGRQERKHGSMSAPVRYQRNSALTAKLWRKS